MSKYLKNQKGYALVLTIILTMLFFILSGVLLVTYLGEFKSNRYLEERTKAIYLAEGGLEHALYLLENEEEPSSIEVELSSGYKYKINYLSQENQIEQIIVESQVQRGNKVFSVTLTAKLEEEKIINITTKTN
ncbi:hypothetical protein SAMN02745227_00538 [Anaerobranca californiensis DSM 14826]|jgi:hypothetical protein|uniref:Type II secretory pathway, pseudopilin PulG n=1 Tax=Anaerobranca californiensis DSM 14826 TaxID=1120989 RepID=A0A1M6LJU7_9FIRM|nr:pilus assembly PilX N-terminal domain-containing protein [Anaerobranca californiensis]SHJ71461.1 hypothetical protein SAMN02745227_00538 [Anaerobranca californiensis DSM 14826]